MNALRSVLIALLFCSTTAMAAPASEGSIKELLAIVEAQKLIDGMLDQIGSQVDSDMQRVLAGKAPTARQRRAIESKKSAMIALIQRELAWGKLEPMYVRMYQESLTEEEVAGALAFYKTPAGQALIHKLPVLMQKAMLDTRKMLTEIAPQLQKIQKTFVAEMSAASKPLADE